MRGRRLGHRGAVANDLLVARGVEIAVSVLNLQARRRSRQQHSEEDMTSWQPREMVIVAGPTLHPDAEPQPLVLQRELADSERIHMPHLQQQKQQPQQKQQHLQQPQLSQ